MSRGRSRTPSSHPSRPRPSLRLPQRHSRFHLPPSLKHPRSLAHESNVAFRYMPTPRPSLPGWASGGGIDAGRSGGGRARVIREGAMCSAIGSDPKARETAFLGSTSITQSPLPLLPISNPPSWLLSPSASLQLTTQPAPSPPLHALRSSTRASRPPPQPHLDSAPFTSPLLLIDSIRGETHSTHPQ